MGVRVGGRTTQKRRSTHPDRPLPLSLPLSTSSLSIHATPRPPLASFHPQISSALKDVTRIMRADGMQAQLWEAQVFTRPALRRVQDRKASAARAAGRKFRWSMGWVARRRERGF